MSRTLIEPCHLTCTLSPRRNVAFPYAATQSGPTDGTECSSQDKLLINIQVFSYDAHKDLLCKEYLEKLKISCSGKQEMYVSVIRVKGEDIKREPCCHTHTREDGLRQNDINCALLPQCPVDFKPPRNPFFCFLFSQQPQKPLFSFQMSVLPQGRSCGTVILSF